MADRVEILLRSMEGGEKETRAGGRGKWKIKWGSYRAETEYPVAVLKIIVATHEWESLPTNLHLIDPEGRDFWMGKWEALSLATGGKTYGFFEKEEPYGRSFGGRILKATSEGRIVMEVPP